MPTWASSPLLWVERLSQGVYEALVVGGIADGGPEVVGGEAGEAVAGPNGDPAGGEAVQGGRSVRDLQQEEVGGRRPDPDAGQRGQGGGELLADGG
jgi:hypothetical protein